MVRLHRDLSTLFPSSDGRSATAEESARELRERADAIRTEARELTARHIELRKDVDRRLKTQGDLLVALQAERSLRSSIHALAATLRRLNVNPEAAVHEVRELVKSAAPETPHASSLVLPQVVAWTMEAYFAPWKAS